MHPNHINTIEAALFASAEPLTDEQLLRLFRPEEQVVANTVQAALKALAERYASTALVLRKVASGWRFQVKTDFTPALTRLWEKKAPKYTRAALETLALIAYRQPITRAEIEAVRGVVVSTGVIKSLMDRRWIKIVGRRDVPGKPALFATTKAFLDYFDCAKLSDLPPLPDAADLEKQGQALQQQLDLLGLQDTKVSVESSDDLSGDSNSGDAESRDPALSSHDSAESVVPESCSVEDESI